MASTKRILLAIVGTIGLGYLFYKGIGKNPDKYSLEWIKNLSDDQWRKEREFVQDQFRNPQLDTPFRENCKRILNLFDEVKSMRDWAGEIPKGPTYSREHGRSLYKKD